MEIPGIEPGAFHMQSERATTALYPLLKSCKHCSLLKLKLLQNRLHTCTHYSSLYPCIHVQCCILLTASPPVGGACNMPIEKGQKQYFCQFQKFSKLSLEWLQTILGEIVLNNFIDRFMLKKILCETATWNINWHRYSKLKLQIEEEIGNQSELFDIPYLDYFT